MDYDGLTNIVDVYIRHLRSKIDDKFPAKLIHTVRGIGYMLDIPEGESSSSSIIQNQADGSQSEHQ
jgi:DNA-binding winged helix-turn-helix (wHTH) protein